MEGKQFKGCPVCGDQPEFREIVGGSVWTGKCSNKFRIGHEFYVMSWTSLKHCQILWNQRHGGEE